MKTRITLLLAFLITSISFAQQGINYKALIKDGGGNVLANQNVDIQFIIYEGVALTNVYQETHTPNTDANGIVIVNIGEGTTSDDFTAIDWGSDDHHLNVQINTGSGLTDMGTTQFMAVPYALQATNATTADNAATKIDELSDGKSDANGFSVFLGLNAGFFDDGTNRNVGIGKGVLQYNTAANNTATGFQALFLNTDGNFNTANGFSALTLNTTGYNNTAIGSQTLYFNEIGHNNTAVGAWALISNIDGFANTAIGSSSLNSNTYGDYNTANGYSALYKNTTGNKNIANGYRALYNNIGASFNTAIGYQALYSNGTGNFNIAIGHEALYNHTSGAHNIATGHHSLYNNTTGFNNTAYGSWTLFSNEIGRDNTANGYQALYSNIDGIRNTANGYEALRSNTEGFYNTANGYRALWSNTQGFQNTANGFEALYSNTGSQNTATGYKSLEDNTTGKQNIAIGAFALGLNTTGDNNIGIGVGAMTSSTTVSDEVIIGNISNNKYRIWTGGWVYASDRKLKHTIQNIPVGLDFVLKLRPVAFVYNNANNEEKSFGFIAQEVKEAVKLSNLEDNILVSPLNEQYLGLRTTELISVLTKAIQEQQEIIESQKNEIKSLIAEQQSTNTRLNKIEALLNTTQQ